MYYDLPIQTLCLHILARPRSAMLDKISVTRFLTWDLVARCLPSRVVRPRSDVNGLSFRTTQSLPHAQSDNGGRLHGLVALSRHPSFSRHALGFFQPVTIPSSTTDHASASGKYTRLANCCCGPIPYLLPPSAAHTRTRPRRCTRAAARATPRTCDGSSHETRPSRRTSPRAPSRRRRA
jgi:hypothetical protein